MCWQSGNLCICTSRESERQRGEWERGWTTVQLVLKRSASKHYHSWKQEPFPKIPFAHPPCSFFPHALYFCLFFLHCWGCLCCSLISCVAQSPQVAGCCLDVKPTDRDHRGAQKHWTVMKRQIEMRWLRKTNTVETKDAKKKVCVWEGQMKRGGEKTSKGKRGRPQGCSLCLGPKSSVWHRVWHLTVMPLPVSCCVGNVPVSFHFCGDSCLSCVGILVVSDRKWKTEVC